MHVHAFRRCRAAVAQAVVLIGVATGASAAGVTHIGIDNPSVLEGNSGLTPLNFTVTRSGDPHTTVRLSASTADGTATAPSDYVSLSSQNLTLAPGQSAATVAVSVNGDTLIEPDETLFLSLAPVDVSGPSASFAAASNFIVGSDTRSATAADINGDGLPDLIVSNTGSSNVSVLLNTTVPGASTQTFAAAANFGVGAGPRGVRAVDLNGDGRPDLIVANSNGTVSVLLDTTPPGAILPTFTPHADFTVGSGSVGIASADFNGDGRADIVVTNSLSHDISILFNTTAPGAFVPTFAAHADYAAGAQPFSVCAIDVNRDGRPDLAVAGGSGSSVFVLINNTVTGAPAPAFAAAVSVAAGSSPFGIAAADLDGDGLDDLAVANIGGSVSTLRNITVPGSASPSFAPHVDYPSSSAVEVAAVDLNGDGRPDLAVSNFLSSGKVSVLINDTVPGAAPAFQPAVAFGVGNSTEGLAVADFNHDGLPDLAATNSGNGNVSVLLNTAPQATPGIAYGSPTTAAVTGVRLIALAEGDLNGDGRPDVVTAPQNNLLAEVLINTTPVGAATPSYSGPTDFGTGAGSTTALALADLNGDGRLDIIGSSGSTLFVLLNTTAPGSATPSFAVPAFFTAGGSRLQNSLAVGDLNGDGRPDIAVSDSSGFVAVLLNTTAPGAATPTLAAQVKFAAGSDPFGVAIGDLNGDGLPDLAVVDIGDFPTTNGGVTVLLNATAPGAAVPVFGSAASFGVSASAYAVGLGDFNGDGRLDLAVAERNSGKVAILLNTTATGSSPASFAPFVNFPEVGGLAITVGDLNGDGRPDLVFGNENGALVSVLLNLAASNAASPNFSAPINLSSSNGEAVGIADINGDGLADIVVSNFSNASHDVVAFLQQALVFDSATGTGTIVNDDALAFTMQFSAPLYTVVESQGSVPVTITRSGSGPGASTVHLKTVADGTATAGADFTAIADMLVSFASGETSKTVNVLINNDLLPENVETFSVALFNPAGGTLGSPATDTVYIADDDGPVACTAGQICNSPEPVTTVTRTGGALGLDCLLAMLPLLARRRRVRG